MRACVLTATGGIDQLDITEVPDAPAPTAGEVRVSIRAAALNHLDLFVVEGLPAGGGAERFPHIVGADGAGVVETVGPGVTSVQPGDRVLINPGISDYSCEFCRAGEHSLCVNYRLLGEHLPGTMAELVTVPAQNVVRGPNLSPALTWAEAAAFSLVTLTAWRMLVTSSDDAKLAAAKQLGADVTLNHRTQKVATEVRALTNRRGVDVVVENVGAATWDDSLRCLRRGGRLVTCGATSGPHVNLDLRRVFWHHWSILGSTMGNAAEYAEVVRRLGQGELRPVVDRAFPIERAREAYERLAKGQQLGKVVVEVSS